MGVSTFTQPSFVSVATHAARNAIAVGLRNLGMLVYTQNDDFYWAWNGGTAGTDADWTQAGPMQFQLAGSAVSNRGALNFKSGAAVADNPGSDRADVTIDATTVLSWYDVRSYGADPTGTTDSATAIQAAITAAQTAGGGTVFFPPGTFRFDTALTVVGDNIVILGSGVGSTIMASNNSSGTASITITGSNGAFGHLTIGPKRVRGVNYHEIVLDAAIGYHVDDVVFQPQGSGQFWGVLKFSGSNSGNIYCSGLDSREAVRFLTVAANLNDLLISRSITFASIANGTAAPHIEFGGTYTVEAITFTACDFVSTGTVNTCVLHSSNPNFAYNRFIGCYFDSAPVGVQLDDGSENDFIGCWFSPRGDGGIVVAGGDTARFIGGEVYMTGGRGVIISGGWGHMVQGMGVVGVGATTPSAAIEVGLNCTGARVLGNLISATDARVVTDTTTVGILIDNGATNVLVEGNDLTRVTLPIVNNSCWSPSVVVGTNLTAQAAPALHDNLVGTAGTTLNSHTADSGATWPNDAGHTIGPGGVELDGAGGVFNALTGVVQLSSIAPANASFELFFTYTRLTALSGGQDCMMILVGAPPALTANVLIVFQEPGGSHQGIYFADGSLVPAGAVASLPSVGATPIIRVRVTVTGTSYACTASSSPDGVNWTDLAIAATIVSASSSPQIGPYMTGGPWTSSTGPHFRGPLAFGPIF